MKKLVTVLFCGLLLISVLAGCSRPEPEPTQEPTQALMEVPLETQADLRPYLGVELTYRSMAAESDPEAAVLAQAADYFEKMTGAKISMEFADGEQPDITEMELETLEDSDLSSVLDLTQMAQAADYDSRSYEVLRQQVVNGCGYLAGIVYKPQLYGVYYNRDAFLSCGIEADPRSWAEYLQVCAVLDDNGYVPLTMDLENTHLALELHMERTLGTERLEQLMHQGGWRQDETGMDLIQRIIDFADVGYLVKRAPVFFPSGQNKLAASNAAMVVGSNELCAQVEQSTLLELNWGVFAYPGDGTGTGVYVDSRVLTLSADCENPQAAFDFIMLLTTGEFDQLRADVTLGIPADPGNVSPISGVGSCLMAAQPRRPWLMDPQYNEVFARVYNGWYKTGTYFGSALNDIAARWVPEETQPKSMG